MPGKAQLDRRLGRCDVSRPEPPAEAGPLVTGRFDSVHRRTTVDYTIAYPPGHRAGDRLGVCVLLHGAGWGQRGWFDAMRFHRHLAGAVATGTPPFALAACDGGRLFWHRRTHGEDPQAMVQTEFLPLLARRGLITDRIAVLGCSMGGYGALLLAATEPGRCAAAVASSPAVWTSYPGGDAFDSAADFARHDLLAQAGQLRGMPVRVECGESDPFRPGVAALRDRLPAGAVRFEPGCHEPAFWEHLAPGQLAFVGTALAASR